MIKLSVFALPISKRQLSCLALCVLPLLASILRPANSNAQLFGDPCDRVKKREGILCYNWKSKNGASDLFLKRNYVLVTSVGEDRKVIAKTPYGWATGKWDGKGNVYLKTNKPGLFRGSKIGCLGRYSTGRKWGYCGFID